MLKGKVSVSILNYNGGKSVLTCVDSVIHQTYQPLEALLVDNASTDGSLDTVRRRYPDLRVYQNKTNLGFSGGHNIGIAQTSGEFVLTLNTDVVLKPTFVEEMLARIQRKPNQCKIGGVQGKLVSSDDHSVIDTTGLILTKSRRNFERGQGERDAGQFDQDGYVFGADACAGLYSRAMLEDVAISGEYFDETFFAYREIVDLSWRAQLRGWRILYAPRAIAFHERNFTPKTRKQQPPFLKQLSYRNRYLMIIKNDSLYGILRHFPYIVAFEVAMLGYVLVFEPHLLKAIPVLVGLLPAMWRKRQIVRARALVSDREVLKWFV